MDYEKIISIVNGLTERHMTGLELMVMFDMTRNQFYRMKERMNRLGILIVYNPSTRTYSINRNRILSESEADLIARLDKLELTRKQTDNVLKTLRREHYPRTEPTVIEFSKQTIKFGIIADTHCGSEFYRPDILLHAGINFMRQNVDFVINAGDSIEGMSNRDGHIFELDKQNGIGVTPQAKYMAKEFEVFEGLNVYSIEAQGSHGGWAQKLSNQGFEIGPYLEDLSGPYKFLDYDVADLTVNGITIRIRHPAKSNLVNYINGLTGGDKPHMLIDGHFHSRAGYKIHRNIHAFDAGCFRGYVNIVTNNGPQKISRIKVGDWVLTHKQRFREVTKVFVRKHYGTMVSLFSRKGDLSSRITSTDEHPILIERNGKRGWIPARLVKEGDYMFIMSNDCKVCGAPIPHYNTICKFCNPSFLEENQIKIANAKGGQLKKKYNQSSKGWIHLTKDILPYCDSLIEEGWIAVPVGAGIIPDIVAFKDGKVVLFELEHSRGIKLKRKQTKYEGSSILEYVDDVVWVPCGAPYKGNTQMFDYEYDPETGFIKVQVIQTIHEPIGKIKKVYNLEVDEDNSYIASKTVVHNCMQNQTPFLKRLGSLVVLGYWIVEMTIGEAPSRGTQTQLESGKFIESLKAEFIPFYDKGVSRKYINEVDQND